MSLAEVTLMYSQFQIFPPVTAQYRIGYNHDSMKLFVNIKYYVYGF